MTNFEKFKDEILHLSKNSEVIALKNGTPVECDSFATCTGCGFRSDREIDNCDSKRIIWLCEEYKERPKLTKKQLKILEVIETGWLARDKTSDVIFWYSQKPIRDEFLFIPVGGSATAPIYKPLFDVFDFIKWEDEPYSVEEMLTWEVENDKF